MTEEQLGLIAQGTTRWIERWYGSEPMKGSSIITVSHDEIAVIGGDKETHRQVRKVVMAHNAALEALDTERTRADKAEQRERELREALWRLESANNRSCGALPQKVYDAMIAAGMSDALTEIDEARRNARQLLRIQPEPDPLVNHLAQVLDKAEQRERELRGGLEKFCKAYRVCGGPGALHDAYLEAEQILSRALIQPEPDPLVEAVKEVAFHDTEGFSSIEEYAERLRAALAKHGLSIVKGES